MNLFIDSSTSVDFNSGSDVFLTRNGKVLRLTLTGCLFEEEIYSIFSDLRKTNSKFLRLKSLNPVSDITVSHQQ